MGIPIVNKTETYSGLPNFIGHSKTISFNFLLDRAINKLNLWKPNTLSYAVWATLIKVVAHVIPTYVMRSLFLPKSLCKKMEIMASRFWWVDNKVH